MPGIVAPPRFSSTGSIVIKGTDAAYDTGGLNNYTEPALDAYVLVPGGGADKMAYAVYAVGNLNAERPVDLVAHVTDAPFEPGGTENLPLSYYIGVADYTRFAWHWTGPYAADASIDLNAYIPGEVDQRDRFVSANSTLFVAVATAVRPEFAGAGNPLGLSAARIETLTLQTQSTGSAAYLDTRPHFASIESIGAGGGKGSSALDPAQYVTLSWTHVFDFNDPANEALLYKLYRRGPVDSLPLPLGSVNAPGNSFTDPLDIDPLIDPPPAALIPGARYTYFIRAYNPAGYTPFDQHDYSIPLFGPTDVAASDKAFTDMIALTWTKAEGATGYKIYRDGEAETNVIASVGDVAEYDDSGITDYVEHTYRLKSTNQYLPEGGAWSNTDTGWANAEPVAGLNADPLSGTTPLLVELDAGASYDPDDGSTPGCGITGYIWDWQDDGVFEFDSGTDATVSHVFEQGGLVTVTVRVMDNDGTYGNTSVTLDINWRPVARLSADPLYGDFPLTVDFDAGASSDQDGSIVKYEFDFGDGGGWVDNGTSPAVQHTYNDAGIYSAYVRVTDNLEAAGLSSPLAVGSRGDWWMFGRNPQQNRCSPYVGAQTNHVKWVTAAGDWGSDSSPVIAGDGTIYVGSADGRLYAVNPDGSHKWSFPTGGQIRSAPAIGVDGTVYAGSFNHNLYAIYPEGTLKWSYPTGGNMNWTSPSISVDGTVYIGGGYGDVSLYAINQDGTLKWTYVMDGYVYATPTIATDGTIYVGSDLGSFSAINPDGTLKWTYTTAGEIVSSAAIGADGTVYVGCDNHMFYAINPDGTLQWSYSIDDIVRSSPAIGADGTVYVGTWDYHKLYAFNLDGTVKWSFTAGGNIDSSPAVGADGTVYVGSWDHNFYAINPDSTLKWSYTTSGVVRSSPAIGADGTVYVGSGDGKLYAFGS